MATDQENIGSDLKTKLKKEGLSCPKKSDNSKKNLKLFLSFNYNLSKQSIKAKILQ